MKVKLKIFICILVFCTLPDLFAEKNSTLLYKEASILAKKGNIDGAIDGFNRAIKANPYYSKGYYGLGKAYLYKKGMLDESIKKLRMSVNLDKKNAKGYFYLGVGCLFSKKYHEAIDAFSKAYKYDNTMIEALYNIGVAYDIIRVQGKAEKYFDQFMIKRQKKDKDILF